MSGINDLDYLKRAEQQAREQAEDSNSNTARIAHLARADEYASKASVLKREPQNDR